jgi:hypothetical protein
MVLVTLVSFIVGALVAFGWWGLVRKNMRLGNWLGCAVVFVWLSATGVKLYRDHIGDTPGIDRMLTASAGMSFTPNPNRRAPAPLSASSSIGSVDSMIAGLEAKLAANPEDAKGWALLAQSYSFIGDAAGTERALARAVALGFDAGDLRARVEHARRDTPHPIPGR